jgi:transketolase
LAQNDELQTIIPQVKRDILRMVHEAQSGHPGGSLGCTEFMTTLFYRYLRHDPHNFTMDATGEDVFVLSNGHISPVYYSILARRGYFPPQELGTFRKINSRLQGHPATAEGLPGIRIATGSLGQGLSVAIGAALAKKQNQEDRLVYSLHGDGEMQEGQNWEAFMFGAHHRVDNLIMTIDFNNAQIDGPMQDIMSLGDMKTKVESFGWIALTMDGNDLVEVNQVLDKARSLTGQGKPVSIVMYTKMGAGVDFMEDNYQWHGVPPTDEQLEAGLAQLTETLGDY